MASTHSSSFDSTTANWAGWLAGGLAGRHGRSCLTGSDRPQRMNVMDYASKIISSTSTANQTAGRAGGLTASLPGAEAGTDMLEAAVAGGGGWRRQQ
jgi:hypothetical protein